VGPIVLIPDSENIAPGQRTMLMRPDPSLADSRFFYYLLSSPAQQDRLQSLAGGSTVAHLNVADVRRFPLDVPSLGDQRAIVDVLGALDDKIAVNMRLVLTSVNLAAAIFDQSLSQPKLRNVSLDTIAGNIPGRYLARENYDGGDYFVYGSNSVMGRHSAAIHAGGFSVLAKIGSYCGNVRWTQRPAWVNNNASAIVPSAGTDPWILRQVVSRIDMGPHKAGTGQPYIRMGSLFASHVDLPGRQECAFIGPRLKALAEAECMAEEENVALTATRDALIPKLMSGKLRVRDAEKLLAGVL
jgi:type I restriction enzyme S subunit